MEEKKDKTKLSYEQLENVAKQLSQQNRELFEKLNNQNNTLLFKRMDYLFEVLKHADKFDTEFVISCAEEIKVNLIIKQEEEETDPVKDSE